VLALLAWLPAASCSAAESGDEAALVQRDVSVHNRSTPYGFYHSTHWLSSSELVKPSAAGFDSVAVKDPSIVFHNGTWHLFFTARGPQEYTLGYTSAAKLEELSSSKRVQLSQLRGERFEYAAAPQVFYFEPQETWYMIFQVKDLPKRSNDPYYPMFSTNDNISDPSGWSAPEPLVPKDSIARWIDPWVICDKTHAYLFYTRDQHDLRVRKTSLDDFPLGWGKATSALDDIHEAAHVYKVKGQDQYQVIYEERDKGNRRFGLAKAKQLSGPWHRENEPYAEVGQLLYSGEDQAWTDVVSHGEALRTGFNQELEYDPKGVRWIIQGMHGYDDGKIPYDNLRWSLGLIDLYSKH